MKILKTFVLTVMLLACAGTTLGEELSTFEPAQNYQLKNAVYVTGIVQRVRTGENLVDLKTPEGLKLTVPIGNLPTLENRDGGYQELETGMSVKSRSPGGVLGLEPAENGMFWLTIDDKKVVCLHPNDIDDDVFDDDTQTVRLDDGREVEISLEEYMRQQVLLLEL